MDVRKRRRFTPFTAVLGIVLALYAVSMTALLLWGVFTALKTQEEFRRNVALIPSGAPWDWAWGNFVRDFENFYVPVTKIVNGTAVQQNIWVEEMLLNTLLYTVGGAFIQTLVPCAVAYVTSRFKFRFSAVVQGIVIVTMIIPIVGSQASELELLMRLGIYDTIWGNWIQKFNFLGMYYLVFFAAFKLIPNDYAEAAYIDGASEWRVMVNIMFPLVATTFFTVMLLKFIDFWNDYQTPLLYLPTHPTLAYGVFRLSTEPIQEMSTVPMRMAACIIMAVPVLIVFIVFRNKLMGNLSMGGIKE